MTEREKASETGKFEDTVRNLLRMKPKPHDEAKADKEKGRDKPAPSE